jgi:hypothetical protein
MKQQLLAVQAEIIKNKYAAILWMTFIAFGTSGACGNGKSRRAFCKGPGHEF